MVENFYIFEKQQNIRLADMLLMSAQPKFEIDLSLYSLFTFPQSMQTTSYADIIFSSSQPFFKYSCTSTLTPH